MHSDYLKAKLKANEHLNIVLTRAFKSIGNSFKKTVSDVASGAERLTYYGACLSGDEYYKSACYETFNDDSRLVMSLREIYHRKDVILDMVNIYFNKKIELLSIDEAGSILSKLQKMIGFSANYYAGKSNKLAISMTIAGILTSSDKFRENHFLMVSKFSSWFLTATGFYAKAQVASLAARKLKIMDDDYFNDLYANNLEMLYFLIEPSMSQIIYQVNSGDNKADIIADALYKILRK